MGEHDDTLDDLEQNGRRGSLGDLMRKAISAGIGAVFMTEESVRSYVRDSKLPRDVARFLIDSTQTAKEQFFEYLAREISGLVRKSDLPKALEAFLQANTIEINAKIRFRREGHAAEAGGATQAEDAAPSASDGTTEVAGTPPAPVGATTRSEDADPLQQTDTGHSATPPPSSTPVASGDSPPITGPPAQPPMQDRQGMPPEHMS
jgi:hypothetical protein